MQQKAPVNEEQKNTIPRMFLLFSHTLTPDQIEDAKNMLGVSGFVEMPPELRRKYATIPPDAEDLSSLVESFEAFLYETLKKGDYLLIQGDFGVVCRLVQVAKTLGGIPVYATTKREVRERHREDGSVEKVSIFKHVRFRKYV